MEEIRMVNVDDLVPIEYQGRRDFVLNSEMQDLCTRI